MPERWLEFRLGGHFKLFTEARYNEMFTTHGTNLTYVPVSFGFDGRPNTVGHLRSGNSRTKESFSLESLPLLVSLPSGVAQCFLGSVGFCHSPSSSLQLRAVQLSPRPPVR